MMKRSKLSRKRAENFGRLGENLASLYLRLKLYSIVAKRVKTHVGEIDLIAKKGKSLVFVEVKMRKSQDNLEQALEAVNKRRISRAAGLFLSQNSKYYDYDLRFDVIFIAPYTLPKHYIGAFNYLE